MNKHPNTSNFIFSGSQWGGCRAEWREGSCGSSWDARAICITKPQSGPVIVGSRHHSQWSTAGLRSRPLFSQLHHWDRICLANSWKAAKPGFRLRQCGPRVPDFNHYTLSPPHFLIGTCLGMGIFISTNMEYAVCQAPCYVVRDREINTAWFLPPRCL